MKTLELGEVAKSPSTILVAALFTILVLSLGYISFGIAPTLLVTAGFLGGFILWLLTPFQASFAAIRWPFFVALALFAVHRAEEHFTGFFRTLAGLTGQSVARASSLEVIVLVTASIGGWLLVPVFFALRLPFGHYLAWTFFASMGITELAHILVFPFLRPEPFAYFPGMASVLLLAPVAWWGMWRMSVPVARKKAKSLMLK